MDLHEPIEDRSKDVELSIRKKFRKDIWCKFTKAINRYELVKEGDSIAVCISGGKDSWLMAKLFQELTLHNKFSFDLKFIVMDHSSNGTYFGNGERLASKVQYAVDPGGIIMLASPNHIMEVGLR